jgi:epoxyqueuosine reductase
MHVPALASAPFVDAAIEAGFVAAGVVPARRADRAAFFDAWLAAGRHGSMAFMASNATVRVDTTELLPNAKSVLCVADRYPGEPEQGNVFGQGRIARYARGRDYHKHMKRRLHTMCDAFLKLYPQETFRACVDTAPLLEREVAAAAGLGQVGKNTMLIQQGTGSWMLLGAIVTTASIQSTEVSAEDPCGTCTRCIDACPTDALTPFAMDATCCVSYLTIEHRGAIDSSLHEGLQDWVFGCDICQDVCPHNQPTQRTVDAPVNAAYGTRGGHVDLLDVLQWTETDRIAHVGGTSATRAKLDMWRRNAAIVARNQLQATPNAAMEAALDAIVNDPTEPEMVRQAAGRRLNADE